MQAENTETYFVVTRPGIAVIELNRHALSVELRDARGKRIDVRSRNPAAH